MMARRMDKCHMTERILDVTMEIICLLTGQSFPHLKSDEPMTITVPPAHFLIPVRNTTQKILDATQRIIELLTGEVPIRYRDAAVYFSTVNQKNLGHEDVVMEHQPPLTSPDGSRKRNPPQRRRLPLDYTQDGCTASHHDQSGSFTDVKVESKAEEETDDAGDQQSAEEVELMVTIKEEDFPIAISSEPAHEETSEGPLPSSPPCKMEDGDVTCFGDDSVAPNFHPGCHRADASLDRSGLKESWDSATRFAGQAVSCNRCFTAESSCDQPQVRPDEPPSRCLSRTRLFTQNAPLGHQVEKSSLQCCECGKGSDLFSHAKTHSGEKPFSCSQCGKSFGERGAIAKHELSHAGIKPFICGYCGKSFVGKSYFLKHQSTHAGERPFPCPECSKCFVSKSQLAAHRQIHSEVRPHSCQECGKGFMFKCNLVVHQRAHTGDLPYTCSECGKSFSKKSVLDRHFRGHTGEKPYTCHECGKRYTERRKLERHRAEHSGVKSFQCSHCTKTFLFKPDLATHEKTHSDERPFSCSECGKCYRKKCDLMVHLQTHTGEKRFACSECGDLFPRKRALLGHMKTHLAEKPFLCSACGRCFTQNSDLIRHQETHFAELPFPCRDCGKRFKKKWFLTEHQRMHTGEKPFACTECKYRTSWKADLQKHLRTHTGEPYVCQACGKSFSTEYSHSIHRRDCHC